MPELVIVGGGIDPAGCPSYSSYALLTDAGNYLLDCGESTVGRLKKLGIDPLSLRAIFITHMHYDHMAGLFGLLYGIWAACRRSDEVPEAIRAWSTAQGLPDEELQALWRKVRRSVELSPRNLLNVRMMVNRLTNRRNWRHLWNNFKGAIRIALDR